MWRYNRAEYRRLRRQARAMFHQEGYTEISVNEGADTPEGFLFKKDGSCRLMWEEPWTVPFFQTWDYAQECRRDGRISEASAMIRGCRQIRLQNWLAPQLCVLP